MAALCLVIGLFSFYSGLLNMSIPAIILGILLLALSAFMALIVPLVETYGISTQLCVLAYAFGDGFSNIMYPTNPVLLISLGSTKTSYKDWLKKTWKFLLATWIITNILLIIGLYIG